MLYLSFSLIFYFSSAVAEIINFVIQNMPANRGFFCTFLTLYINKRSLTNFIAHSQQTIFNFSLSETIKLMLTNTGRCI